MPIVYHAVLIVSYVVLAAALGLVLPELSALAGLEAFLVAGFLFLVAVVSHVLFFHLRDSAEAAFRLDTLTSEILGLDDEVDALATRIDRSIEEIRETGDQSREELIAEVKVLQTLLAQVAEKSSRKGAPKTAATDAVPAESATAFSAEDENETRREESEIFQIMRNALNESRIDLFLQPIVRLPARRAVHYECFSRVRDKDGQVIFPREFMPVAEISGLVGTLDNVILFRCMQLIRRLGHRRQDARFFCNISSASLNDEEFFPQFIDYMTNNRDMTDRLIFEFSQADAAAMRDDVVEQLLSLGRRGYRFSLDQVTNVNLDIKGLADQFFEFVKIDADRLMAADGDIHAEDMAGAMKRFDINLIVSKIEDERAIIDILDYDVAFGQGFLFGEPKKAREDFEEDEGTSKRA